MIYGSPPPEPDLIAERGTDQWRDAVHAKQAWISEQLSRGASLDELVDAGVMDKYGEGGSSREGRLSHDYEKWQKALRGEAMGDEGLPSELGEAQWNVGNFRRQVNAGDFTEWPPGSGKFFNDPANDQGAREWYNEFGDRIPPPEDPGPDIDYNVVNEGYGGSIKNYLSGEAARREAERRAKPITNTPTGPAQQVPNTNPPATTMPSANPVWGAPANQPTNPQQSTNTPNRPPTNNAANMTGAFTGNSPNTPSRFATQPAFTGGNNPFTQTPSRIPQNPVGNKQPRRSTFGIGWR